MKTSKKHKQHHAAWVVARYRNLLKRTDLSEARLALLQRRIEHGTAFAMDTTAPRPFVRVVASLNHWADEAVKIARLLPLISGLERIGLRS